MLELPILVESSAILAVPTRYVFVPNITHVIVHANLRNVTRFKVTKGRFMCGPPRRVWHLDVSKIDELDYNNAVDVSCRVYEGRMHNIVADNCHSHVAFALNNMKYGGRDDWNMVRVWWAIWTRGKWVSPLVASQTIAPSAVLFVVIIVLAAVLPSVLV